MSAKSNRAMLEQAEAKIAEAQAAFNKYDADNSGTIDDIEVLQLMADMGLLEKLKTDKVTFLANYFATADTNGDGVLDFEEFKGFYNAAVDDAAGRGGPTKAASASDKKKAAIAAGALEKKGLPGIEPADQEEVVALSQKLNSKLEHVDREHGRRRRERVACTPDTYATLTPTHLPGCTPVRPRETRIG